jgi:mannose/fructose/N-acetylgalactosamine-specific phosphotransferase system component IIC
LIHPLAFNGTLVGLALLAGVAALDAMAAFQFMISRPLVLGWAAGWLGGDTALGLTLGCILELLWINVLQVGAFVPPDLQFATLFTVGGTLLLHSRAALGEYPDPEAVAVFLLALSIPLGFLGGLAEQRLRRLNIGLSHWVDRRVEARKPGAIGWSLAASMTVLFLKGACLVLVSLMTVLPLAGFVLAHAPAPLVHGLSWAYWLTLLLGMLVVADLFWNRRFLLPCAASFGAAWLLTQGAGLPWRLVLGLALAVGVLMARSRFLLRPEV